MVFHLLVGNQKGIIHISQDNFPTQMNILVQHEYLALWLVWLVSIPCGMICYLTDLSLGMIQVNVPVSWR